MKIACVVLAVILMSPCLACGEGCPAMKKKLEEMRKDYHSFATGKDPAAGPISFEELSARLDKIVKLKEEMRNAEPACAVPPRSKKLAEREQIVTQQTQRQPKPRSNPRTR